LRYILALIIMAFGFLAGCTAPAPVEKTVYITLPPVNEELAGAPRHSVATKASVSEDAIVIKKHDDALASARRYLNYKNAQPKIIDKLADLAAESTDSIRKLNREKEPKKHEILRIIASQKADALALYLRTKPDSIEPENVTPYTVK
jgi:hypothetical protein